MKWPKQHEEELLYYKECSIINKEIWDLLNKIDENVCQNGISVKCYIRDGNAWSRINDNIINIGKIDKNNIYIVENIIYSKNNSNKIIDYIISNEYKDCKKNIIGEKLILNIKNAKVQASIFNLLEKEKYIISEKLKIIIS